MSSPRLSWWKVAIPIAIGVGVTAWLAARDYSSVDMSALSLGWRSVAGIALALLAVAGRDFGLTWRFHTIASPSLTWRQSLRVDLMCAFTSAITPSAVGGSALAVFYLNAEGVKAGRGTALTLTTLFLDELFFVVFCPLIVLVVPFNDIFGEPHTRGAFLKGVEVVFWTVYAGIVAYTALLYVGILRRPRLVGGAIRALMRLPLLRRWQAKGESMAANLEATSEWVRGCPRRWWANVLGATVLSWFSRYLIVNALFWGFVPGSDAVLVFARQFVVWVVLMVSPTPGSSGVSEWMFTNYYGDLIGDTSLALVLALVWRAITYYLYLFLGLILASTYFKKSKV